MVLNMEISASWNAQVIAKGTVAIKMVLVKMGVRIRVSMEISVTYAVAMLILAAQNANKIPRGTLNVYLV